MSKLLDFFMYMRELKIQRVVVAPSAGLRATNPYEEKPVVF